MLTPWSKRVSATVPITGTVALMICSFKYSIITQGLQSAEECMLVTGRSRDRYHYKSLAGLIVFKHFLQTLAGKEDSALHRAERQIHLFGDFIVFVSGNVHREGDTVFV